MGWEGTFKILAHQVVNGMGWAVLRGLAAAGRSRTRRGWRVGPHDGSHARGLRVLQLRPTQIQKALGEKLQKKMERKSK